MDGVVLLVIGAVVLVLVAIPMVRRGGAESRPAVTFRADEVPDESAASAALGEIELDRAMGKLSEADYVALRAKYERELATAAAEQPALSEDLEAGVEPAVALALPGASEGTDLDARAEALVRRYRALSVTCPACGVRPEPDAQFCSHCGKFLLPCPSCGRAVDGLGARFCPGCGATLAR